MRRRAFLASLAALMAPPMKSTRASYAFEVVGHRSVVAAFKTIGAAAKRADERLRAAAVLLPEAK